MRSGYKFSIYKAALLSVIFISCGRSAGTTDNGSGNGSGTNAGNSNTSTGQLWLTKGDQTVKLQQQTSGISFSSATNANPNIVVDENTSYQSIDGFGFALTDGSAQVINKMSAAARQTLLQELFGNSDSSIGITCLRVSIGASDLSSSAYTYDDVTGDTDLTNFDLTKSADVIKVLKDALFINPNIKITAAPWSAPTWMKDNQSFVGGSLLPQYYATYAKYFVKYVQAMQSNGINITSVTPQNEPLNPNNNPSLYMTADQENIFIRDNLGPAFKANSISTKIINYDHNADNIQYSTTILNDVVTSQYIDGSAFHLYAGNISALGTLHNSFPSKNIYFTEIWTSSAGSFADDLKWHTKNIVIGAMQNWSKNVLEWNLANDNTFGPHTAGGCIQCQGALTVYNDSVTRNVSYYIIAHASKFVPQNSVRIASTSVAGLNSVAFKRPDGKIALIVENDNTTPTVFNISYNNKIASTQLDSGSVATYIF